MTKAKKVIGCVQHDCAECKTMRRVYEAAMKWHKWASKFFTPETMSYADRRLSKACAAAAIRALKEKK